MAGRLVDQAVISQSEIFLLATDLSVERLPLSQSDSFQPLNSIPKCRIPKKIQCMKIIFKKYKLGRGCNS